MSWNIWYVLILVEYWFGGSHEDLGGKRMVMPHLCHPVCLLSQAASTITSHLTTWPHHELPSTNATCTCKCNHKAFNGNPRRKILPHMQSNEGPWHHTILAIAPASRKCQKCQRITQGAAKKPAQRKGLGDSTSTALRWSECWTMSVMRNCKTRDAIDSISTDVHDQSWTLSPCILMHQNDPYFTKSPETFSDLSWLLPPPCKNVANLWQENESLELCSARDVKLYFVW